MVTTWRVFSQQAEPLVAAAEWKRAAERFFGAKLEIVAVDEGCVVSIEKGGSARRFSVVGRMRTSADLTDALAAETRSGFTGLYDLAERRCEVVWVVEREGPLDDTALLIAAILASVCLGPIVGDDELFGVRTARAKLETLRTK
jgi:hypothetical protein